jgi:hypothetical protein
MLRVHFYGLLRACGTALVLSVALAWVTQTAHAAQIDITNCQAKRVKICAYDDSWSDAPNQSRLLGKGETSHFKCKANCKFWMLECAEGTCHSCRSGTGYWVDHSWGRGTYHLVSLDLVKDQYSPAYKSSDLEKADDGAACPN